MASIGSRGEKLDLHFRQGATFGPVPVRMTAPSEAPIDLTNTTIRAKIRKNYDNETAYIVDCEIVNAINGQFAFSVSDETTATMPCGPTPNDPASTYVWDLEILFHSDGSTMPVFFGTVRVAARAAR